MSGTTMFPLTNVSVNSTCGFPQEYCAFTTSFYTGALPVLIIIITFGLVANGLVLYIIAANKAMQTVPNCYAANICITDIIFLFFACMTDVIEYALGVTGSRSKGLMPQAVRVYFHLVLTNATCSVLCALACDRYLAIVHPFKFRRYRKVKFAFLIGIVAWLVSIVVCTPIYAGEFSESIYDVFTYHDFFLAIVTSCVFSYAVPLVVMTSCYAAILYSLWFKTTPLTSGSSASMDSRVLARNLAVLKSALVITVVYALNFGIFYAVYLVLSLCPPENFVKVFTATHAATLTASIGMCVNPILYGLMQPNFRPYVKEIWRQVRRLSCVRCVDEGTPSRRVRHTPEHSPKSFRCKAEHGTRSDCDCTPPLNAETNFLPDAKETSLTESTKDHDHMSD